MTDEGPPTEAVQLEAGKEQPIQQEQSAKEARNRKPIKRTYAVGTTVLFCHHGDTCVVEQSHRDGHYDLRCTPGPKPPVSITNNARIWTL